MSVENVLRRVKLLEVRWVFIGGVRDTVTAKCCEARVHVGKAVTEGGGFLQVLIMGVFFLLFYFLG